MQCLSASKKRNNKQEEFNHEEGRKDNGSNEKIRALKKKISTYILEYRVQYNRDSSTFE